MKKLIGALMIGFLMLNVIRVITDSEVMTAETFLEVTQSYFELNNMEEPLNLSYQGIVMMQSFKDAFNTEIIYTSDNLIEGFFNYVMQAIGGIADIVQFGMSWLWNMTIGWVSKFLAYILTLLGMGKY